MQVSVPYRYFFYFIFEYFSNKYNANKNNYKKEKKCNKKTKKCPKKEQETTAPIKKTKEQKKYVILVLNEFVQSRFKSHLFGLHDFIPFFRK